MASVVFLLLLFVSHVQSFPWSYALHNLIAAQDHVKFSHPEIRRWYPSTFWWRDRKNFAHGGEAVDPISQSQPKKLNFDGSLPEEMFEQPTDEFYPHKSFDNRISNVAPVDSLPPSEGFGPIEWASKSSGDSKPIGFSDPSSSFMDGPQSPQGQSKEGLHSEPSGFGWEEAASAEPPGVKEQFGADGFGSGEKDCDTINTKSCSGNTDCECYGFYRCSGGRCVELGRSAYAQSVGDQWHDGPAKTLGISKRH